MTGSSTTSKNNSKKVVPSSSDSFFPDKPIPYFSELQVTSIPPVNIIETGTAYEMQVAVPGMTLEYLSLLVQDGMLSITGNIKETSKSKKKLNYTRHEFYYEEYERTFSIPPDVSIAHINGLYENGLLTVVLPKRLEGEDQIDMLYFKVPVCKSSCHACKNEH